MDTLMTRATRDVIDERNRQLRHDGENFSFGHDDTYVDNELTAAAVCYALRGTVWESKLISPVTWIWPWAIAWFKPSNRRRNLVKAAALLIAEIERIDRGANNEPN